MIRTARAARGAIGLLLSGLGAVSCGGGEPAGPRAEVGDSAGIRVVTYDLAATTLPVHRTLATHNLEIGSVDGAPEQALSRVVDLDVTRDGSLVISDALAPELRVYDADGTFVRAVGQRGEGPGEFVGTPTIAGLIGDTVFAFDSRTSRVSAFTLSGALAAEVTLRSESIGRPTEVIRLDDGTYLSRSSWVDRSGRMEFHDARLELDSLVVEHLDADGTLLDTVRVMADRSRLRAVRDRGGGVVSVMQTNTPFAARAFLRTDGARPIFARSDAFVLDLLGGGRAPHTLLRVLGVENPATAEQIRAHQEAAIRAEAGDEPIDPMVVRINLDHLPERLPAFGDVVVAKDGDVWVSRMDYDLEQGADWLVFSPEGTLRGTVHTPPRLQLFAIGTDHVIGVVTDELDVPYVRRHPLVPA